ncbi:MAG: FkbM family methyltransferase [Candidatus Omnitrophota bacterium]
MKIKKFGGFRIAYREGTADELVLGYSFDDDIFFSGVPEYSPRPKDTIIDIGAHIGTFSILAASRAMQGRVYAVEAGRENFEYLKKNIALNNLSNIFISNLALTDSKGTVRLYYPQDGGTWGYTIAKEVSGEYEEVEADTLASFMKDNNILCCNFMKLNCEGAEYKIILSTPRQILQRIKILLVLYHSDIVGEHSEDALIKHLKDSGFSITIRERTKERGWIIAGKTAAFSSLGRIINSFRFKARWKIRFFKKKWFK